jgi:hypothetical protein
MAGSPLFAEHIGQHPHALAVLLQLLSLWPVARKA